MQTFYQAKHLNKNIKIKFNCIYKFLIIAIMLFTFAFYNTCGILSYFTSKDSLTNNFTLAGTYTVQFDANSGTGTMPNQEMFVGLNTNLNSNTFTRTGFGFNGWNTEPDGTGISYADGVSVQDLAVANSSIILYAQWIAGAYSITYNLDGGVVDTSNPTAYTIDTASFILNNPTKTGYEFTGWSGTDLTGYTNLAVTITQGSIGDREYTAHFTPNTYYIRFNANGGTGTMENQEMTYGTSDILTPNSFEKAGYIFARWSTEQNGSGDNYSDKQNVNNLTATNGAIVDLYAQWVEEPNEAEIIGDKKYPTVKAAINAIKANGGQKTIRLLKNVQLKESLTIADGKDIVLDLQNFTLSNGTGCTNIIKNNGTLEILGGSNGTIQSNAAYGAIDNNATGNLTVSGGNIITTGTRQAIYNNGGIVEVTGNAYLSTSSAERATVLNHKPDNGTAGTVTISGGTIVSTTTTTKGAVENEQTGTMIITGGTIISNNNMGVDNKGTLTIGVEDGDVDTSSPTIQGATYGVSSASSQTLEFYDGTVKGKTNAFNNENYITDTEDDLDLTHGSETIDGDNYETAYLDTANNRLVFYGNGGTPTETIVYVQDNTQIGALLPSSPTRLHYSFDGWYTDPTGGTQITSSTVITSRGNYYAHWTQTEAVVTFIAPGGTASQDEIVVNLGSSIGSSNLPTATREHKTFVGWFTDKTNGTKIDGTETITADVTYYAHWSAETFTVEFDANQGTLLPEEEEKTVEMGDQVGSLPVPTRTGFGFTGWYTAASGGIRINETQVITADVTYYAQWISNPVAQIGPICYASLQDAVNDVPTDNTETTITLLTDTLEAVDVAANKNIVLNLQNYKLYNNGSKTVGTDPVAIRNKGTIRIANGTVTANAKSAAINNETGGRLIITGGNVTNTGTGGNTNRQAIYNNGGTLEISGTAYISAKNSGAYQNNDRGAIQNLNRGTIIITGGTIESSTSHAIVNQSGCTLTLGTKDNNLNSSTPVIQGKKYGIQNKATLKFYDGIVKGVTDSISGTITDTETGATRVDDTETIGTDTYNTTCYQ